MIEFAGEVTQTSGYAYIYFIIAGHYLYIGETQRIPVRRWGEHFSKKGSFWVAMEKKSQEVDLKNCETRLIAYRRDRLSSDLLDSERRLATQWIEHDLHVKACSNAAVGSSYTLISDTTRTAPRFTRHLWLHEMSAEIFRRFSMEILSSPT